MYAEVGILPTYDTCPTDYGCGARTYATSPYVPAEIVYSHPSLASIAWPTTQGYSGVPTGSEEAEHRQLSLTCYINFSVHHSRNSESYGVAELIAVTSLIAVVNLLCNIGRIVGMQNVHS